MFIITLSARDLKIGGKAMDESSVMNCDAAVSENSDCKPETRERSMSRYLYILGLTAMFIYGSYSGVIGLESSINIEGGLGTTSVMIVFIVSSFSCIFLLPIVIDFLGPKFAIILGELGFVAYIASNFYPSWYTLIPAAVVHGITESGMWAGGSCYVTFLAKKQWEKETRRNEDSGRSQEALIYRYFGIYYSMLFCGELLGSGIDAAVLLGLQNQGVKPSNGSAINASFVVSSTQYSKSAAISHDATMPWIVPNATLEIKNPLAFCGSQDCQADYIYDFSEDDLEKFHPSKTSIYFLLSLFTICALLFICLQAIFLPEASVKEDQTRGESILPTTTSSIKKENSATQSPTKTNRVLTKVKVELKGTFRHVISPLHLFIAPYIFYNGLYYAYEITEYTRAFVSCSIGVEKLGLATGVLGAFTISGTTFGGHVLYRLGRTKYAIVVTCWHLGTFLCSNFWQPHPNNTWVIYLLGAFLGFGQGILNNMLKGLTAHYFQGTEVVAFSVKNCITNLGIVAGTAWSTSLCVYEKIYVVIGFLLFSLVCFFIAERLFQKQKKTICM
uniref:protein unc-93 homolog A-like isoform X1 n=1 Tax=Ciona intestinalis TaxID=7719 RepID=UPI000EF445F9|nr:protein unc-93 homolog A-like isoform X1 [Ciona intestinalis]|eukprot:XP_026689819.1 protein unc-93 homolog A-like isoform X1 [Ciona intestinalis]